MIPATYLGIFSPAWMSSWSLDSTAVALAPCTLTDCSTPKSARIIEGIDYERNAKLKLLQAAYRRS